MPLKYGKLPARHDSRDLLYASYAPELIRVPAVYKRQLHAFGDWQMLGNDQYGDCVFAGADHETMMWDKEGGHKATFSADTALSDYAAVTGFDPVTGEGDNGTDVRTALGYRRKTGLADTEGKRHKLAGYVALEVGNIAHVKEAIYLFGAVGLGFEVPASAQQQFADGQPWTVVPGQPIEGGHYVPAIGYGPRSVYVVTWGRTQEMSWQFFSTYTDEAYGLLSAEFLRSGRSPAGFSLAQLKTDLRAL